MNHVRAKEKIHNEIVNCRKVGLEGVSLHSLRHSHASSLLSKGVPIAVVAERLGHSIQSITLSIYSHAIPAETKAAPRIWNDGMADLIQETREKAGSERMLADVCRTVNERAKVVENKPKDWRGRRGSNPRPPT